MFVEKRILVVPLPVHIREVELASRVIAIDVKETVIAVLVGENRGSIVCRAIYATAIRKIQTVEFYFEPESSEAPHTRVSLFFNDPKPALMGKP